MDKLIQDEIRLKIFIINFASKKYFIIILLYTKVLDGKTVNVMRKKLEVKGEPS